MNLNSLLRSLKRQEAVFSSELKRDKEIILEFAKYEKNLLGRILNKFVRKFIGNLIRLIWIGEVHGLSNLPKRGSAIIALNHVSYFDFLCFSAISPRPIHFLSAEKFFTNPFWAPLMWLTGQIKVNRTYQDKSKVFEYVYAGLKDGRLIGIFPEGTRSPDGNLLKAYTGVAKIALTAKVPVIPVGLKGTHRIMAKHHKLPRISKAHIYIGDPINFEELHKIEHNDTHYRMVTDLIMHRIAELSGQEYLHAEYHSGQIILK
ncbi:MAG TPA: lysophospholipid acyltransferase family protein [Verrucomicrobiae bacterium]|nr:lysophospholipid acyltransferase family protein [Verrucomicrobiae bacterium]